MDQAIILCSGGLDSVVSSFLVRSKFSGKIKFLFFNYNQKSLISERKASIYFAKKINADFIEISLEELSKFSTSYINKKGNPKSSISLANTKKESDSWYVPCRNTLFLTYALILAESDYIKSGKLSKIFVGFKNEGKEPFPDTTKEYLRRLNSFSKTFTKKYFPIIAPVIELDKEDIINLGLKLGIDLENTFSCYSSSTNHCGRCLSCRLRKKAFYWANKKDTTIYLN